MHRPCHQSHVGTRFTRSAGNGKTHFSARKVRDAPHGVDGLERRAGRDQHFLTCQHLGGKKGNHLFQQFAGLQHAPIAGFAAGLVAVAHTQHRGTVLRHLGQVALGGGVRPHLAVHGGRQQQGYTVDGPGQAHQAQQLVGPALHQAGNEISAARRNHDGISLAAEVDVRHVVGLAGVPL